MPPEEIRALLTSGDIAPPYTIHMMSGKSYSVADATAIWSPPGFPGTIVVAIPRKSIAVLRLDAVDSITCEEHEPATSARRLE
jgi:hypothetical protein